MDINEVILMHIITLVVVLPLASSCRIPALYKIITQSFLGIHRNPPCFLGTSCVCQVVPHMKSSLSPGPAVSAIMWFFQGNNAQTKDALNSNFQDSHESQIVVFTEMVTLDVKLFSSLRLCTKLCFLIWPGYWRQRLIYSRAPK